MSRDLVPRKEAILVRATGKCQFIRYIYKACCCCCLAPRILCITCHDTDGIRQLAVAKDVDNRCFWRGQAGDKNNAWTYPQVIRKAVHKLLTSTRKKG